MRCIEFLNWFNSSKILFSLPSLEADITASLSTLIEPSSSIERPLLLSVILCASAIRVNSRLRRSLPSNPRLELCLNTEIILLYPDKSSLIVSTIELSSVLRDIIDGVSPVVCFKWIAYVLLIFMSLDGEYCSLPLTE